MLNKHLSAVAARWAVKAERGLIEGMKDIRKRLVLGCSCYGTPMPVSYFDAICCTISFGICLHTLTISPASIEGAIIALPAVSVAKSVVFAQVASVASQLALASGSSTHAVPLQIKFVFRESLP